MTRARACLVSAADTPYYHVVGRCVRRAYLCGNDIVTGKSFEHRRRWILERLKLLSETFAIDLCAYALMSNHYHLVVRIDPERVKAWSAHEVIERWTQLFTGPVCAQQFLQGQPLSACEQAMLDTLILRWSERLGSLSWFMRCLNEVIARMANQEDGCTGRFWEGRFKSQALLDPGALFTAMSYVDLNPIRAGIAPNIQESDFTSIQQRLEEFASARVATGDTPRPNLLPFVGGENGARQDGLPFNVPDYLALVDSVGRMAHADKRGSINPNQSKLLEVLGIEPTEWFKTVTERQKRFELFVGAPNRLRDIARRRGWCWVRGLRAGQRLYRRANE